MRKGNNPLREQKVGGYPPIIAAVIVHLPSLRGYHEQRMEVVKNCLDSMRQNAGQHIPVWVYDNGSCAAFRDWLIYEYKPEFMTLSPNIGKSSARAAIIRSLPPSTVVGISDDDMYFYPGWFNPQYELLHKFPDVGLVSGYPTRTASLWANKTALRWAKEHAQLETGQYIPEAWNRDYAASLGTPWDVYTRKYGYTEESRITYRGMKAYAMGSHCQFICYAGRLAGIVQHNDEAMSEESQFDRAVDNAGLMRLCTTERYTRHMGNVIDPELRQELFIGVNYGGI